MYRYGVIPAIKRENTLSCIFNGSKMHSLDPTIARLLSDTGGSGVFNREMNYSWDHKQKVMQIMVARGLFSDFNPMKKREFC